MTHVTRVNIGAIKNRLMRQGRILTKFTLTFIPKIDNEAWNKEYERRIIEENKNHLF